MRRVNIGLLLLGLVLLVYLVWKVSPQALYAQMSSLGWGLVLLILSEGMANLAHTVGWQRCLSATHPRVPLTRLFPMAMTGFAVNYLTPTASVGGEVSRAALLASTQPGPEAASSVLLDKLTTAIAHLLLALAGALFLFSHTSLPSGLWLGMAVTTGLLGVGMGVFMWIQWRGKLGGLLRWLESRGLGGKLVRSASRQVTQVDDALARFYRERPLHFAGAVGWHLLGHSMIIFQVWIFLELLGQHAPLATVAIGSFLSLWCDLLTFAVPMNLGALEGSRILALKTAGSVAAVGMAFGVAMRIAQVFWACYGLVSYFVFTFRNPGWRRLPSSGAGADPLVAGTTEPTAP